MYIFFQLIHQLFFPPLQSLPRQEKKYPNNFTILSATSYDILKNINKTIEGRTKFMKQIQFSITSYTKIYKKKINFFIN